MHCWRKNKARHSAQAGMRLSKRAPWPGDRSRAAARGAKTAQRSPGGVQGRTDGYTFCVDGAQVAVLQEVHHKVLRGLRTGWRVRTHTDGH